MTKTETLIHLILFALLMVNVAYALVNANHFSCAPPTNEIFTITTGSAFLALLLFDAFMILVLCKIRS